jgi:choline dehydrogenase-like flavoprotein
MTTFDAVVVGSGAGGAPLACRLCEAGWKVLLLERGRAYVRSDFDRDEIEWSRRDRFLPSTRTDPHTRRNDEGKRAVVTRDGWISTVLGGGTVHMSGFFPRAHAEDARQATRLDAAGERAHEALDWAVPFSELAPFYDAAERELGVSGAKGSGLPPLAVHPIAQVVDAAAAALKLPTMPTPRGILSVARPEEERLPCAYRQMCGSYGCPNDAKSSMPATYIRRAAKTGRLTVWTEAVATRVLLDESKKKATGVQVRRIDTGVDEMVTAGVVVVAGGAIESARLLLLSDKALDPHAQIGKHLWFSLFVELSGFFSREKHGAIAELMTGSPFINRSIRVDGVLSKEEQAAAKVDRGGMLHAGFTHDNPIHRAERVATETLSDGKLLWGRAFKQELRRQFREGRQIILEGFGELTPHLGSRIDLDPDVRDRFGLPVARITQWHHPRDRRVAAQIAKDGQALLSAMGAEDIRVLRSLGTTTPLQGGTCRFGLDPRTSVTTPAGHLHAVDNVYVTDGGSLPSSLTVPPTLTIIANSLRIAAGIIATQRSP